MDPDFWRARWKTNAIGFNQAAPSQFLIEHVARAAPSSETTVFVPLSGKSKDLAFLRARGHRVIGCELVEEAVAAFHDENAIPYKRRRVGDFKVYESDRITTYAGDFFRLTPAITGPVDWIFDRASLIAWPPEQQPRYLEHLFRFLPRNGSYLLISVEYDQQQMSGPPFSASVEALLGPLGGLEPLGQRDALEERFRARGCTKLTEKVWLFRPKED
jgi:thiopurine S-methyltransferase